MESLNCLTESLQEFKPPEINRTAISAKEYAEMKAERYNNSQGNMLYIDCPKCRNKGYIMKLDENFFEKLVPCECLKNRLAIENMLESGLGDTIKKCTFSAYKTETEWQSTIKRKALEYLNSENNWFYIGGQSGGGKTHICTAISGKLISKGKSLRYVIWRNLFHELQGLQFNDEKYRAKIKELQIVDVLYIDDFMKSLDKAKTGTELNFAFEVINARYTANKQTIISSEYLTSELYSLDSATAGRIIEKSGEFIVEIERDDHKNYRLGLK